MLKGKNVNLRIMEKDDLALFAEWVNNPEFYGQFRRLRQKSRAELEKQYDALPPKTKWFLVEKKDQSEIGCIEHYPIDKCWEISYALVPDERGKGYCTEAVKIIVDYLFLSRNMVRVQAHADTRNLASQKVLEKAGFKREGILRKYTFAEGEWRDDILFSILRHEWKGPKVLTKATT